MSKPDSAPSIRIGSHAADFARGLKTLGDFKAYEYICTIRTSEPDRFIVDTIYQMPVKHIIDGVRVISAGHIQRLGS